MKYTIAILTLLLNTGCVSRYGNDCGNREIDDVYIALEKFGPAQAQSHDMKFLFVSNVSGDGFADYSISYSSRKKLKLDEARKLGVSIVKEFYSMIQSLPETAKLAAWIKRSQTKATYTPTIDNICVKIGFWDGNVDRMMPPYIAEVFFFKGSFSYYQADPSTQTRVLVHQESYDDALKIVNQ
jgi:hypothetical protein